jgi:hypothetical protein
VSSPFSRQECPSDQTIQRVGHHLGFRQKGISKKDKRNVEDGDKHIDKHKDKQNEATGRSFFNTSRMPTPHPFMMTKKRTQHPRAKPRQRQNTTKRDSRPGHPHSQHRHKRMRKRKSEKRKSEKTSQVHACYSVPFQVIFAPISKGAYDFQVIFARLFLSF